MTDLAELDAESVVLEIGTGSGYQAAVLGEIARQVYTIEIVAPLGRRAAATLERIGYENIDVRIGDGYRGWPEHAPFDAIIVTAAPEQIPQPLIDQLKTGARLVVPVGPVDGVQSLRVLEKNEAGDFSTTDVLPVRFVPFTRDE
jgi:protein-L-isoaspartate(D-aspartate) O-methyltransferase